MTEMQIKACERVQPLYSFQRLAEDAFIDYFLVNIGPSEKTEVKR
jgi:hypothetical protein